jgi:hypothetical protein
MGGAPSATSGSGRRERCMCLEHEVSAAGAKDISDRRARCQRSAQQKSASGPRGISRRRRLGHRLARGGSPIEATPLNRTTSVAFACSASAASRVDSFPRSPIEPCIGGRSSGRDDVLQMPECSALNVVDDTGHNGSGRRVSCRGSS